MAASSAGAHVAGQNGWPASVTPTEKSHCAGAPPAAPAPRLPSSQDTSSDHQPHSSVTV